MIRTRTLYRLCLAFFTGAWVTGLLAAEENDPDKWASWIAGHLQKLEEDWKSRDQEYGVGPEMTVYDGFFFHLGHYVDPPYELQRRGMGVYINDRLVAHGAQYARTERKGEDIEIDVNTSAGEVFGSSFFMQKTAAIAREFQKELRLQKVADYLKGLPCAKEIRVSPEMIDFATLDGTEIVMDGIPLTEQEMREEAIEKVEAHVEILADLLGKGHILFHDPRLPYRGIQMNPLEMKGRFEVLVLVSSMNLPVDEIRRLQFMAGMDVFPGIALSPPRIYTTPSFWKRFYEATAEAESSKLTLQGLLRRRAIIQEQERKPEAPPADTGQELPREEPRYPSFSDWLQRQPDYFANAPIQFRAYQEACYREWVKGGADPDAELDPVPILGSSNLPIWPSPLPEAQQAEVRHIIQKVVPELKKRIAPELMTEHPDWDEARVEHEAELRARKTALRDFWIKIYKSQ